MTEGREEGHKEEMNEAETRTEHIDPAWVATDWGVVAHMATAFLAPMSPPATRSVDVLRK